MPVRQVKFITREMVRSHPEKLFLFGDNLKRVGMGGQAREMRGEPNAIGIATKVSPGNKPEDFFCDDKYQCYLKIIKQDLALVFDALKNNKVVIIPKDGLGTGLSDLPNKAPRIFKYLQSQIDIMMTY